MRTRVRGSRGRRDDSGGAIGSWPQGRRHRRLAEEELGWRKAQFIFELAQDFDRDSRFQRAVRMLLVGADVPQRSNLARILAPLKDPEAPDGLSAEEKQARYDLDRYLDFFDRMYYFTCVTKALSINDIGCFGWYVTTVSDTPALRAYAEKEGYENVLKLAAPDQGSRCRRAAGGFQARGESVGAVAAARSRSGVMGGSRVAA